MRPWSLLLLLGCGGGEAVPRAAPDMVFLAVPSEPSVLPSAPMQQEALPRHVVISPEYLLVDANMDGIVEGETDPPPPPPPPVPKTTPVPEPAPEPVVVEPTPVPEPAPVPEPVPAPEPTPPPVVTAPEPAPSVGTPSPADLLQQPTQAVKVHTAQQEQRVDEINDELLVIVNKLRAEKGLPPLPAEPPPEAAAAAPP